MRCFLLLPITSHGPKIPFNPLLGPVQVHGGTNRRDGPRRFVLEKSIFADGRWTPRPRATLELPSRRSKPEPPCCASTATDCTVPGTKQPSGVVFHVHGPPSPAPADSHTGRLTLAKPNSAPQVSTSWWGSSVHLSCTPCVRTHT